MYPAEIVLPMKAELTESGFNDMKSATEVSAALQQSGTTLVVVNSVCGCAAGSYFTFVGKNNAVLINYNKPTV